MRCLFPSAPAMRNHQCVAEWSSPSSIKLSFILTTTISPRLDVISGSPLLRNTNSQRPQGQLRQKQHSCKSNSSFKRKSAHSDSRQRLQIGAAFLSDVQDRLKREHLDLVDAALEAARGEQEPQRLAQHGLRRGRGPVSSSRRICILLSPC